MQSIWIVDDNESLLEVMKLVLEEEFEIRVFNNPLKCLSALRTHICRPPDILISDYRMQEMNGLELLTAALREHPRITAYLCTAVLPDNGKLGRIEWIEKPFDIWELLIFQIITNVAPPLLQRGAGGICLAQRTLTEQIPLYPPLQKGDTAYPFHYERSIIEKLRRE